MEASTQTVTCPKHPSKLIQRINIELFTDQHLYCLDCILQEGDLSSTKSNLKTLPDFLDMMAAHYLKRKQTVQTTSRPPQDFTNVFSRQNEILTDLSNHISQEKQKIESTFDQITQDLVHILTEKKNELLHTLDQQLLNLRYWYVFFDKQIKKTYPTDEDIPHLFPSKEDLTAKLEKISNITQLTAFAKSLKEDLNEDKLEAGISSDKKDKLFDISRKLSQMEAMKPVLEIQGLKSFISETENFVKTFFQKYIDLKNPIQDALLSQITIDSKILEPQDNQLINEWLPKKHKFCPPILVYRETINHKDPANFDFDSLKKGSTLILVKYLSKGKTKSRVYGGFMSQNMKNLELIEEAFIFSVTSKEIRKLGATGNFYGNSGYEPNEESHFENMVMCEILRDIKDSALSNPPNFVSALNAQVFEVFKFT